MAANKTNIYSERRDLLKLPAEALLKDALVEIGKLKAYIDEKEYELSIVKKKLASYESNEIPPDELKALNKEAKKEAKKMEIVKSIQGENLSLKDRIAHLVEVRDSLLCKIIEMREKYEK